MDGVFRRHFGKEITDETKFRLHSFIDKAAWKFSSEG
jgi:hypothetical protein